MTTQDTHRDHGVCDFVSASRISDALDVGELHCNKFFGRPFRLVLAPFETDRVPLSSKCLEWEQRLEVSSLVRVVTDADEVL